MKEFRYIVWWIPQGKIPTIEEAKEKLEIFRQKGANHNAFSFKIFFLLFKV